MSDAGRSTDPGSIRAAYEKLGARDYYVRFGASYRNPHEGALRRVIRAAHERWMLNLGAVLDLACGSGEATVELQLLGAGLVHGIDPFTSAAYRERTGREAETMEFDQIAAGSLAGRRYTLIVCSFALHLVEPSRLPRLVHQLAQVGDSLLVITPHKRPQLRSDWGWSLSGELVLERVRSRYYVAAGG
jgi:SAM-dependent methyltransferase